MPRKTFAPKTQSTVVKKLIHQIVETVHPIRIVLFGSRARGDARPDSDIDLMIVMPNGTHRRHTSQKLRQKIYGLGINYDLVVATPEDLEKYGNHPSLIYYDILREGKEIYAA